MDYDNYGWYHDFINEILCQDVLTLVLLDEQSITKVDLTMLAHVDNLTNTIN